MKSLANHLELTFNRSDTLKFMVALENSCKVDWNFRCIAETAGCRAEFRRRVRAGEPLPRLKFRGTFEQHEAALRKRNRQGFAIFYSLNVMHGGVKAQHCCAIRAIPLDLDHSPLPDIWTNGIKPHIVVETSPGRYQCLFRVFHCEDSEMEAAEDIGRRLAAHYGGDPSVADRARVLRLPGFLHQKSKPFVSRTVLVNLMPRCFDFEEYTLDDFKFLPKLPKRSTSRVPGTLGVASAKLLFKHYPVSALKGNAAWQTFAMALHAACGGCEEVAELFFEYCMTDDSYDINDDANNRLRWDSFTADKPDGLTIATLRKLCYDARLPASVRFALFNNAQEDFPNV
ncbi:DNA-primase RepB domain-containing protein [Bradyrhizobium sp. CB3481]|uniref:DNA-primase RepB domain-containing protein n=1 Tax=Bradyrhizobium sp. CB3481 TaxID=3039158 RepID=UPI0024B13EF7|nr:DNA-primase RepB domain-containing protein [Bradyrhizobium sp. CB3481]WFU16434.1 DNA-primase RepB domain-containing protein [Bradyrhizobium sp. CB3481]